MGFAFLALAIVTMILMSGLALFPVPASNFASPVMPHVDRSRGRPGRTVARLDR